MGLPVWEKPKKAKEVVQSSIIKRMKVVPS